jgi:cysteine desulfurase/selenocysteine lyase
MTARLGDRSLFPSLEAKAYLNHAAVSPASAPVIAAANDALARTARDGVGAIGPELEQRERLRAKLGALLGVDASSIGFTANTTQGVINVAQSYRWKSGDRVLGFAGEFPANVTPWLAASRAHDLELCLLPLEPFYEDTGAGLDLVRRELERGARLCAVSLVQFQTGFRMPVRDLAELCHRYGAELFVDAIQGLGVVPFDARQSGVDFVTCGSHKWLMGLEGVGFLYVRPDRETSLRTNLAGWLSHEDPVRFLFEGPGELRYDRPFRREPSFFEGGAQNAVGHAALEPAIDLLDSLGIAAIQSHVTSYLDRLEPELLDRGFTSARSKRREAQSGSLCVRPPSARSIPELARSLRARGIAVTTPDGWLRFAPHWPNALDEVPLVLTTIDAALR